MIAKACLRQGSFAPGNQGVATTGGRSAAAQRGGTGVDGLAERWPLRVSVLVIFERVIVALQWRVIPERSDGVLRA